MLKCNGFSSFFAVFTSVDLHFFTISKVLMLDSIELLKLVALLSRDTKELSNFSFKEEPIRGSKINMELLHYITQPVMVTNLWLNNLLMEVQSSTAQIFGEEPHSTEQ